jgi:Protein of unknown function (DUF2568)
MALARVAVLTARFVSELAALVAFTLWGFHEAGWFGVLPPIAAAAFWGRFIAPMSPNRLDDPRRLAAEIAYFALAAAAFADVGSEAVALIAGATAVGLAIVTRALDGEAHASGALP